MSRQTNERMIKAKYFEQAGVRLTRLAGRFVDDTDTIVAEASSIFDGMLPTLAYVDKPEHPLASALFTCSVTLSLYLALKQRGVDAHDFGSAMLNGLARAPIPMPEENAEDLQAQLEQFVSAAEASQTNPQTGEDVFAVVDAEGNEFDWGFNVTSCAIHQLAVQHNARELVPYMCATDDVMSDKGKRGLRRTGSLALGASHCDFRYQRGGQPHRLAEQYPHLIRITETGAPPSSGD